MLWLSAGKVGITIKEKAIMDAQRFRSKPKEIVACQLRWDTWNQMCDFAKVGKIIDGKPTGCYIGPSGNALPEGETSEEIGMLIPTLEGLMIARQNDWIIRGIQGELYACKPDIFDATYEPIGFGG
jgi:hypothetical protein